jgi:hypothetical protein
VNRSRTAAGGAFKEGTSAAVAAERLVTTSS